MKCFGGASYSIIMNVPPTCIAFNWTVSVQRATHVNNMHLMKILRVQWNAKSAMKHFGDLNLLLKKLKISIRSTCTAFLDWNSKLVYWYFILLIISLRASSMNFFSMSNWPYTLKLQPFKLHLGIYYSTLYDLFETPAYQLVSSFYGGQEC